MDLILNSVAQPRVAKLTYWEGLAPNDFYTRVPYIVLEPIREDKPVSGRYPRLAFPLSDASFLYPRNPSVQKDASQMDSPNYYWGYETGSKNRDNIASLKPGLRRTQLAHPLTDELLKEFESEIHPDFKSQAVEALAQLNVTA